MIKVGKRSRAKYWGSYVVEDIVELKKAVKCIDSPRFGGLIYEERMME